LAKNDRLIKMITEQLEQARRKYALSRKATRLFRSFRYRTIKSWSRKRRVIGKAEHLDKGSNPRFVVTSLPSKQFHARHVYEDVYCARGEMENRIKEVQLDLFGDKASAHLFRTNETRCWLSLIAHFIVAVFRNSLLRGTELAKAQASTLREKLFKIGAIITISVRRVYIRFSSAYPKQSLFSLCCQRLRAPPVTIYRHG